MRLPLQPGVTAVALVSLALLLPRYSSAEVHAVDPGSSITMTSPDGSLSVTWSDVDGAPCYTLKQGDRTLIETSRLGLVVNGKEYDRAFNGFVTSGIRSVNESWKPVFDKASQITNRYRYTEIKGTDPRLTIYLRLYNDGLAISYGLDRTRGPLTVDEDRTEFRFADDCTTWSYNGEHAPKGPLKLSEVKEKLREPVTLEAPDDCCMALLDAAVYDYDFMDLAPLDGCPTGLAASLRPCKVAGGNGTFRTPWHVIQVGDSPGALLESNILVNLNPPCKIEDPSWIEPGLCLWDWRCWGATTKDGFTYDLDMPSWKRLVDFASKSGIRYVMLDANWYGDEFNENSNPMTPKGGADIPNLIRYAADRNVKMILYFNHAATKNFDFDQTLATYAGWGAAGLKYGFLKGYEGQEKVRLVRKIVRKCAEHKLLVDFHDNPIPPSGDRRTWPNLITREFCHAQSDARRSFTPGDFTRTVFVNMLAGPLDMTNGLYDLDNACRERPKVFEEVYSTVAAETARPLIVFTGLDVLFDHGDSYAAKDEMFDFIRSLPMRWDESRVLHGKIGQYITMARRSGDAWYIGSATNEEPRTLDVVLDFLPEGVEYEATLYEDAPDANYKTNREAYRVRRLTVRRGDTIPARMAPGGGHAIRLVPKKPKGQP